MQMKICYFVQSAYLPFLATAGMEKNTEFLTSGRTMAAFADSLLRETPEAQQLAEKLERSQNENSG